MQGSAEKIPELVQIDPIIMVLYDLSALDMLAAKTMIEEDVQVIAGAAPNMIFSQTAGLALENLIDSCTLKGRKP